MPCAAHTLNICGKTTWRASEKSNKNYTTILSLIKEIVNFVKRMKIGNEFIPKLKQDTDTRWYSVGEMLKNFEKHYCKLKKMCENMVGTNNIYIYFFIHFIFMLYRKIFMEI